MPPEPGSSKVLELLWDLGRVAVAVWVKGRSAWETRQSFS